MKATLIYVHDPMCSWCWGFEPVRKKLFEAVSETMQIRCLVGGLAPDSMEAMPKELQQFLQHTWHKIEQAIPGTTFNFDFWKHCKPRRSTYPSNRAVIAATLQGEQFESLMILKIQQAYYQQAKNPSDNDTLIELAEDIGLNIQCFEKDLSSKIVEQMLIDEIREVRTLGVNGFPSLVVANEGILNHIKLDYNNADEMLKQIISL